MSISFIDAKMLCIMLDIAGGHTKESDGILLLREPLSSFCNGTPSYDQWR